MSTHVPPARTAPAAECLAVSDPPLAPAVVAERLAALRDAVASQRLEGLEPSPGVIAALERVVHGELTVDDVLADVRARIAADRRARGEI